MWMRDMKGVENGVGIAASLYRPDDKDVYYETFYKPSGINEIDGSTWFDTYEEAESALLDELLTILENGK
jgi:hypothetical protein